VRIGKPIEQVTSKERNSFKQVVYGVLYGMGAPALAGNLKVTLQEAKRFIEQFLGSFPSVSAYLKRIVAQARVSGDVLIDLIRPRS
jgi:DNA polymerase I